jgi:hypothetical protein
MFIGRLAGIASTPPEKTKEKYPGSPESSTLVTVTEIRVAGFSGSKIQSFPPTVHVPSSYPKSFPNLSVVEMLIA